MPRKPLRFDINNWRRRWLQFDSSTVLHRVSTIRWRDRERIVGEATTLCGRSGWMAIPGIFSRMEAPRCVQCCRAAGIPAGNGAPANTLKGDQANA